MRKLGPQPSAQSYDAGDKVGRSAWPGHHLTQDLVGFLGSQIRKAGENGMFGSGKLVVVTVKLSCVKLLLVADSKRIKMPPWFDNCMQGSLEGVRETHYGS